MKAALKKREPAKATVDLAPKTTPSVRILDAAEELFAQRGFHGVSVRDIAQVAAVAPSHVVYSFGSKEKLFSAVFFRRIEELVRARADRLDEVDRNKKPELEAILRSYVTPLLDRSLSKDPGWRHYAMLVAQTHNAPYVYAETPDIFAHLDESGMRLVTSLRRALPGLSKKDALHGFLFFVSSMLYIFAEPGRLDRLSGGKLRSADTAALCETLVPFCAGGFRALAKRG